MKVRTDVKGGRISLNHNQTPGPVRGLPVRTAVKGGRIALNHNPAQR
jgi:hypothetical protein